MQFITDNLDLNAIITILVVLSVFLFQKYAKGKISAETYNDLKIALLAGSALTKNSEIKSVINIIQKCIAEAEKLDKANIEQEATATAVEEIAKTLNLNINEALIQSLVSIMITKNNK